MANLTREEMQIKIAEHLYVTMDETMIAKIAVESLLDTFDKYPEDQIIHEYNTIFGDK